MDEIREAVLRERLERAEKLIAALTEALFAATGSVVCQDCYGLKRTEHCARCTGLEGEPRAAPRG
jgi:recombinational DNA repair protein RecR